VSEALPGEHLCLTHQGNHSHYATENCRICRLLAQQQGMQTAINNMLHAYLQLDGTMAWPNSREGDMLRHHFRLFQLAKADP